MRSLNLSNREHCQRLAELENSILSALDEYAEPNGTMGLDWWSPLWHAVRSVKAHPLLQNVDGIDSWSVVRRLVPLERFLKADSRLESEDDVAVAWSTAWDKIRYLPGETVLSAALREADERPVVAPQNRSAGYARFLSLCAVLARACKADNPDLPAVITIPIERWAQELNVRPMTVSGWRQWAVKDGILVLRRQHCHAQKRAAEYQINLNRLLPVKGTL